MRETPLSDFSMRALLSQEPEDEPSKPVLCSMLEDHFCMNAPFSQNLNMIMARRRCPRLNQSKSMTLA